MPYAKHPKGFPEPPIRPQRHIDDSRWLDENYTELVQKYPDMWIAVLDKEVVIASKDLGEVFRVARQKAAAVGKGPCVYRFIESPWRFHRPVGVSYPS